MRCIGSALAALLVLTIVTGCSDGVDHVPPDLTPPQSPMGACSHFGDEPLMMYVGWVDSTRSSVDGYNVYKKVGGNEAERLNDTLIIDSMMLGPSAGPLPVLAFIDTLFDSTSVDTHIYWATAAKGDRESEPCELIVLVPADFNPEETVFGLAPDSEEDVPLDTSFTWDAKTGAESYWIFVQEDAGPSPMTWLYRHTATKFSYKETLGVTYGDNGDDSLPSYSHVHWGLAAIDQNNFAFAYGEASFWTTGVIAPLIDCQSLSAGSYSACWDQTDKTGAQVVPGTYEARMQADQFDSTVVFEIVAGGGSVTVPPDCNPACDIPAGLSAPPPTEFSFETASSTYEPGATVVLNFDMPASCSVCITVGLFD